MSGVGGAHREWVGFSGLGVGGVQWPGSGWGSVAWEWVGFSGLGVGGPTVASSPQALSLSVFSEGLVRDLT